MAKTTTVYANVIPFPSEQMGRGRPFGFWTANGKSAGDASGSINTINVLTKQANNLPDLHVTLHRVYAEVTSTTASQKLAIYFADTYWENITDADAITLSLDLIVNTAGGCQSLDLSKYPAKPIYCGKAVLAQTGQIGFYVPNEDGISLRLYAEGFLWKEKPILW